MLEYRNRHSDKPAKANALVKALRVVYRWALTRDWVKANPADFTGTDVHPLKGGEYFPWPEASIERYIKTGTPELALVVQIGLYTGQRIGDCLRMSWADVENDSLNVVQEKTGKTLWIPLHRDLRAVLNGIEKKSTRVLTTKTGRVWTYTNFCDQFLADRRRLEMDEAFVFHGLRKNAVIRLIEAGCGTKEVGSITGQSDEMVSYYARQMDQKKLAKSAAKKLDGWKK